MYLIVAEFQNNANKIDSKMNKIIIICKIFRVSSSTSLLKYIQHEDPKKDSHRSPTKHGTNKLAKTHLCMIENILIR